MKIDIGGGTAPAEGFVNLDPAHGEREWKFALGEELISGVGHRYFLRIPVEDGTVDAVRASHVLEHVPAGAARLWFFNEVHRVLKPGGTFQVIVPMLTGTWHAIADPTHVSFWVPESFGYFDGSLAAHADYGIRPWTTHDQFVSQGWEGHWFGSPVKA